MALKLIKSVWFLSMLLALAALLYVYAGLPQKVVVQEEVGSAVSISNEAFFYIVMMLMAITNSLVYMMAKLYKKQEDLRTWFYGLVTTLNIFFIIGMSMISLYNSAEKFDYGRIGFVIYGSVALVTLWAASWPMYAIFRRLNSKQSI